ncbi:MULTISPECIES: glycerophosphoryl diester phosphodiesterase membrane domain-containing protein [unclassified Streptomyces]|uniref:glycerophosphoryl diester phosphodiesterase membrane domain-containing protein n=1 Tax=unclassified Streptomyces TaxID=2593676 RepID=UPI00136903C0|nr:MULTISPECIES: glycerophosphoryl diester phosphodiesterase membrane domain-containing protein [unclassified Streptomyces]MCW5252800.1 glycerophosphoryl diester phosphodiesterase membrane domain-containing protein [Streptomyces sp. SHP 1-2]MYU22451.1 hypothetical protein [Streptomyces sp. SID8352]
MNDTPGWASPGSAPSDGHETGGTGPGDRPEGEPAAPGTKWSKEQPPPGQWSAPTGPAAPPPPPGPGSAPPPPGPGWGAPPPAGPPGGWGGGRGPGGRAPWGGGWGGPPPAAKPGVIPLRPLGVGEILDGAVSTMRAHWRTVLGISLSVAIFTEIIVVLLRGFVLDTDTGALGDPDATLSELGSAVTDSTVDSLVVFLVTLLGTVIATALLTTVTSRAVLGRRVGAKEAWQDARPQTAKLFGLILLLLLIVFGIVLAGIAPTLLVARSGGSDGAMALASLFLLAAGVVVAWLMIRLSLASPALMLEKQGIRKAMGRSMKLVRGSWWRVFGIQLLAGIIASVLSAIIVLPFAFLGAALGGDGVGGYLEGGGDLGWTFLVISGVGSVIGSMVTFPITAGVTVLLYIDQRIRREALDLELVRAAGLPESGAPGAVPGS